MAAWPTSLPQLPLLDGYGEQLGDNVVRTAMDVGPQKRRRRYTARVDLIQVVLVMTTAQVATLEAFYETTLADGVDAFDWTHPRTLVSASFAFRAPFQPSPIGAGYWRVAMSLELQL